MTVLQTPTRCTINEAERSLYLTLLSLSYQYPIANDWLKCLPDWLSSIKNKHRYANAPYYASIIDKLPNVTDKKRQITLTKSTVTAKMPLTTTEYKRTQALLKNLMPWRKGGFLIGQDEHSIYIDTEWRSDLKWDRVLPHLSDLTGRRVLDVGGGSGYHGYRMVGAGASTVVVLDPSCLFYHQFMAIRHFVGELTNRYGQSPIHFVPVPLDALPSGDGLFHTVFCMGVLYHRPSPFECLWQLKQQLVKGGELVLETLVVEGDEQTVLVPKDRYAMMNNVYFLPSVSALTLWLKKAGFCDVQCVNINITTVQEQRATAWMTYQSLSDFLDPKDSTKTIEGYPAPKRAVMIAKKE